MEPINTRVMVSSDLSGKNLWLLKTFIDSKFTNKNLDIVYTEDANNCDVFIQHQKDSNNNHYCALLKKTNVTLPILPNINPVSLKKLFLYLGSKQSIKRYKLAHTNNNISHFQIYKFVNASSRKMVEFIHNDFHLIINNVANEVHCSSNIEQGFLSQLKHVDISELRIRDRDPDKRISKHYDQCDLHDFKWQMGALLSECFFEKKPIKNNMLFQQTSWPDYGLLGFKKEFIELSALLTVIPMSYDALKAEFKTDVVNSYLNALYMTNNLVLLKASKNTQEIKKKSMNNGGFMTSFKMFLNKIHFLNHV